MVEIHTSCSIDIIGETYSVFYITGYTDGEGNSCSVNTNPPSNPNDCIVVEDYTGSVNVCYQGASLCVSQSEAAILLADGATLGSCNQSQNINTIPSSIDSDVVDIAAEPTIELSAYPNPAKDFSKITFTVDTEGPIAVGLFDTQGHRVARIYEDVVEADKTYTIEYNTSHLRYRIYLIRVVSNGFIETKKLIIER